MRLLLLTILLLTIFTSPLMAADFSTPEGALHSLEHAYIAQDIDAAVASKNFAYEAKAMLANIEGTSNPSPDLVQETSHVLELAFRKQMKDQGFPQLADLRSRIVSTKLLAPNLAEIKEEFVFPDGYVSHETVHVAKSGDRWGVVVLPSE